MCRTSSHSSPPSLVLLLLLFLLLLLPLHLTYSPSPISPSLHTLLSVITAPSPLLSSTSPLLVSFSSHSLICHHCSLSSPLLHVASPSTFFLNVLVGIRNPEGWYQLTAAQVKANGGTLMLKSRHLSLSNPSFFSPSPFWPLLFHPISLGVLLHRYCQRYIQGHHGTHGSSRRRHGPSGKPPSTKRRSSIGFVRNSDISNSEIS